MKKGSSETTREAFCFNLYLQYKPQHKKKIQKWFLEWFIGFSEGDSTFHTWIDKKRKRAGFTIDQQDPKVLYWIKQQLGFGRVLPCKQGWRFQVWDKKGLFHLFCLFYGNLVFDKRQLNFQKWTTFLVFPNNFSMSTTCFHYFEKRQLSASNFVSLDNGWLAGFWQADGNFYAYGEFNPIHIILQAYITQRGEVATLHQISMLISDKKKKLSTVYNGTTKIPYNHLDFASEACLLKIFSYFEKFVLVGEKRRTFLRWKRVWETREKIKNQDFEITEKSIKKLKRLIAATKKTQ